MPITDEILIKELNANPEIELWADTHLLEDDGVNVERVCKETGRAIRTETILECTNGHAGVYHTERTVFERIT